MMPCSRDSPHSFASFSGYGTAMQIPHRKNDPNHNPLLPGLGTADEREELNNLMETIPKQPPPAEVEGVSEPEIKTLRDFVL